MRVLEGLAGLRQVPAGAVLSVGNFDGMHLGHQRILRLARDCRDAGGATHVVIVTFEPHPLSVIRPALAPPRLTPPAIKRALLAEAGVDDLVILPPTPEVLNLTAEDFWAIVRDHVRPTHMLEGHSFTFGKNRGGTIDKLRAWAAQSNVRLDTVEAVQVALLNLQVVEVSSSIVRWLISHGRVRDAAICLGRPYALEGPVVKGYQRGRTIGVPTANVNCGDQLVPCDGVYAARADVDGVTYPAALSVGNMPTFGENNRQVEAFLVGYDGDLYDRTLRVEVIDWLREQVKYDSLDALKEQIARDVEETIDRADTDPARSFAQL